MGNKRKDVIKQDYVKQDRSSSVGGGKRVNLDGDGSVKRVRLDGNGSASAGRMEKRSDTSDPLLVPGDIKFRFSKVVVLPRLVLIH